jgi:hypothetical protein
VPLALTQDIEDDGQQRLWGVNHTTSAVSCDELQEAIRSPVLIEGPNNRVTGIMPSAASFEYPRNQRRLAESAGSNDRQNLGSALPIL